MELVTWDDDIPNRWTNKSHVPNHQAERNVIGTGQNIGENEAQRTCEAMPHLARKM